MAEEQGNRHINKLDEKSGAQLLLDLARLVLLLLWKIIRKGLKIVLVCFVFIVEYAIESWGKLVEWWHDKDTQEKIKEIKAAIAHWWSRFKVKSRNALRATKRWMHKTAIAVAKGTAITARALIVSLFNLKTTLIKFGHLTAKGWKALLVWTRRCKRTMKATRIKRKRAYKRFRKNKGFKGLLIDCTTAISNSITKFMEEDQLEATPDAVTEDDLLQEQIEQRMDEGSTAARIGQKIFTKAQSITNSEKEK